MKRSSFRTRTGADGFQLNELFFFFFFFSSWRFEVLQRRSSCSGHIKPNTEAPPGSGTPPVCLQCQDKDPSQLGQETVPHPGDQAHFL